MPPTRCPTKVAPSTEIPTILETNLPKIDGCHHDVLEVILGYGLTTTLSLLIVTILKYSQSRN